MDRGILFELKNALTRACPDLTRIPDPVWQRTAAFNTWGTNAIEGNTLSREEVEMLILGGESVGGHPRVELEETISHDRVFRSLPTDCEASLTLSMILALHAQVFQGQQNIAPGSLRQLRVFIQGSPHRPPRPEEVPEALAMLVTEAPAGRDLRLLDAIADWHFRFESIHPFRDGNGRIGRLLMNRQLLGGGWPPLHLTPLDRSAYMLAFEAAHLGDPLPLREMVREGVCRSQLDLLDQLGTPDDELARLPELASETAFSGRYLALRARQGVLPAIRQIATSAPPQVARAPGRPRWVTSRRVLRWFIRHHTRPPVGHP